MSVPEKGIAFIFDTEVIDVLTGDFKINPTINAGDFQISKDESVYVNLVNLPTIEPVGSENIKVSLTALEMTADRIVVRGVDLTAFTEWEQVKANISTEATPGGTSKILDILEGDHLERVDRVTINKKNTTEAVLDKQIFGSLLKSNVVIRTAEQP